VSAVFYECRGLNGNRVRMQCQALTAPATVGESRLSRLQQWSQPLCHVVSFESESLLAAWEGDERFVTSPETGLYTVARS
jgi:hypothetical protein